MKERERIRERETYRARMAKCGAFRALRDSGAGTNAGTD